MAEIDPLAVIGVATVRVPLAGDEMTPVASLGVARSGGDAVTDVGGSGAGVVVGVVVVVAGGRTVTSGCGESEVAAGPSRNAEPVVEVGLVAPAPVVEADSADAVVVVYDEAAVKAVVPTSAVVVGGNVVAEDVAEVALSCVGVPDVAVFLGMANATMPTIPSATIATATDQRAESFDDLLNLYASIRVLAPRMRSLLAPEMVSLMWSAWRSERTIVSMPLLIASSTFSTTWPTSPRQ